MYNVHEQSSLYNVAEHQERVSRNSTPKGVKRGERVKIEKNRLAGTAEATSKKFWTELSYFGVGAR